MHSRVWWICLNVDSGSLLFLHFTLLNGVRYFPRLVSRARRNLARNFYGISRYRWLMLIFMLKIAEFPWIKPLSPTLFHWAKFLVLGKVPPLLSVDRTMRAHTSLFTLPTWVCLFVNVEMNIQGKIPIERFLSLETRAYKSPLIKNVKSLLSDKKKTIIVKFRFHFWY